MIWKFLKTIEDVPYFCIPKVTYIFIINVHFQRALSLLYIEIWISVHTVYTMGNSTKCHNKQACTFHIVLHLTRLVFVTFSLNNIYEMAF